MGRKISDTSKVRPAASSLWESLWAELISTPPDCADDARYTADTLTHTDRDELANICAACPLLTPCSAYAHAERPAGAWWPGFNLNNTEGKSHNVSPPPHRAESQKLQLL